MLMFKSEYLPEFVDSNSVRTEYVIFILGKNMQLDIFAPIDRIDIIYFSSLIVAFQLLAIFLFTAI